jgi:hypothetical protein
MLCSAQLTADTTIACKLLDVTAWVIQWQIREGLGFIFEHPATSKVEVSGE